MTNPCTHCTKAATCDNKACRPWQRWFIENWNDLRRGPRLQREVMPREFEGIGIGGVRYALPHRVHAYLHQDPCTGCLCPRDLCVIPCRVRRDWQRTRQLLQ